MKLFVYVVCLADLMAWAVGLQACLNKNQFERGHVRPDILKDLSFLHSTRSERLLSLKSRYEINDVEFVLEFRGIEANSVFTVICGEGRCALSYRDELGEQYDAFAWTIDMRRQWILLHGRLSDYRYSRLGHAFGLRCVYLSCCENGKISKSYCFDYPKKGLYEHPEKAYKLDMACVPLEKGSVLVREHDRARKTAELFARFFSPISKRWADNGLKTIADQSMENSSRSTMLWLK